MRIGALSEYVLISTTNDIGKCLGIISSFQFDVNLQCLHSLSIQFHTWKTEIKLLKSVFFNMILHGIEQGWYCILFGNKLNSILKRHGSLPTFGTYILFGFSPLCLIKRCRFYKTHNEAVLMILGRLFFNV